MPHGVTVRRNPHSSDPIEGGVLWSGGGVNVSIYIYAPLHDFPKKYTQGVFSMSQYTVERERDFRLMLRDVVKHGFRVRRGVERDYEIVCRGGGVIGPYGLSPMRACYQREFATVRQLTGLLKRLPEWCEVTQKGDMDVVFVFPVERLEEVGLLVGAYRRRVLSPEQRDRLVKAGEKYRIKSNCSGATSGDSGSFFLVSR